ncbi:hypothetical protein [Leptolyngbya sp. Cla-17]|uniref:hypothetical protein n=1 Tax=Leptolyngbya sp. Cla-17 TaxID=2803751 RepID=UPI0014916AD0|nr:hypothetical protein [Leptolyngbya sp. Cla-17]
MDTRARPLRAQWFYLHRGGSGGIPQAARIQDARGLCIYTASLRQYHTPAAHPVEGLNSAEQSPTPLVFRTVLEACNLTRLLSNLVLVMHTY